MHQSLFIPFNLTYIILGSLILRNFQHLSFRFGSYTPTHNHPVILCKLANKSCILVHFLKHTAISVWNCKLEWDFHLCHVSFQKHWQIAYKRFFLLQEWNYPLIHLETHVACSVLPSGQSYKIQWLSGTYRRTSAICIHNQTPFSNLDCTMWLSPGLTGLLRNMYYVSV